MRVAVVTPTVGTKYLRVCLESVAKQTYNEIDHYIVLDGSKNFTRIKRVASDFNTKKILLEDNIGGSGWLGHRAYAACSFLVNSDFICYLDEDNWIEPTHVQSLLEEISLGNDWSYSLRKVYDKNGNYLFEDNCESLGKWPVYVDPNFYHIDTSSYIIKTSVAVQVGHTWYKKWDADRQFFFNLKHFFPNFSCTKNYTLCYRLGGNPNSVTKEFFEKGNSINSARYNGEFPWNPSHPTGLA